MDIGNAIQTIRKQKNLSQSEFARKVGIDQSYLSLIENNKKKPSTKLLEKISSETETPLPILFFFSLSEEDVKSEKKELFKIIFPRIRDMVGEIFDDAEGIEK